MIYTQNVVKNLVFWRMLITKLFIPDITSLSNISRFLFGYVHSRALCQCDTFPVYLEPKSVIDTTFHHGSWKNMLDFFVTHYQALSPQKKSTPTVVEFCSSFPLQILNKIINIVSDIIKWSVLRECHWIDCLTYKEFQILSLFNNEKIVNTWNLSNIIECVDFGVPAQTYYVAIFVHIVHTKIMSNNSYVRKYYENILQMLRI